MLFPALRDLLLSRMASLVRCASTCVDVEDRNELLRLSASDAQEADCQKIESKIVKPKGIQAVCGATRNIATESDR